EVNFYSAKGVIAFVLFSTFSGCATISRGDLVSEERSVADISNEMHTSEKILFQMEAKGGHAEVIAIRTCLEIEKEEVQAEYRDRPNNDSKDIKCMENHS